MALDPMKPSGKSCGAGWPGNPPSGGTLPASAKLLLRRKVAILSTGLEDEMMLLEMMGLMTDESP